MKVLDFLDVNSVVLDLKSTAKPDVVTELVELLKANGQIKDAAPVIEALMQREKLGSTGIGQGVAIPHGKSEHAEKLVGALGVSKKGVNFDALDGEPVHVIFLLVAPPDSAGLHLKALARISRLLKDKFFRQALKDSKSLDEIKKIIQEEDEY
jgi:PTS system nitrogen regulatory IIA component